jgi:hypothetical protein
VTEPLTERDRASLEDDLAMEERALERHLDQEPLPHLWPQYHERTEKARAEIERIKAMLA